MRLCEGASCRSCAFAQLSRQGWCEMGGATMRGRGLSPVRLFFWLPKRGRCVLASGQHALFSTKMERRPGDNRRDSPQHTARNISPLPPHAVDPWVLLEVTLRAGLCTASLNVAERPCSSSLGRAAELLFMVIVVVVEPVIIVYVVMISAIVVQLFLLRNPFPTPLIMLLPMRLGKSSPTRCRRRAGHQQSLRFWASS